MKSPDLMQVLIRAVYVWGDATPAHVSYQSQGLAHLLSLPTQADHCMSFRPVFRIDIAAGDVNFVCRRDKRVEMIQ